MQERPDCFIIMPFGKSDTEKRISDLLYDGFIMPALKDARIRGTRIDRDPGTGTLIQPAVLEKLDSARVVVADVSWNNPNVIFELGYRSAVGKNFVIVSLTPKEAAWWVKGFPIIDATKSDAREKLVSALQQAMSSASEVSELSTALVRTAYDLRIPTENPFIERVAAWRVNRARTEISAIYDGRISYKAKKFHDYVGYNFTELMTMLKPGETYYTVSRIDFWGETGVGHTPFLRENKHAADRGVAINRLILVDRTELRQAVEGHAGDLRKLLQTHQGENLSSKECKKNMRVKLLPVDSVDAAIEQYGHFGLLTDKTAEHLEDAFGLLVSPVLGHSLLEGIELQFSSCRCRDDRTLRETRQKFQLAFDHAEAKDIRGMQL